MAPDLWKCKKAAIGWDAPEGHVLWLVKREGVWMAVVHASGTCTTTVEVVRENHVFGFWEADVTAVGPQTWDMWDIETDGWQGRQGWSFETRHVEG